MGKVATPKSHLTLNTAEFSASPQKWLDKLAIETYQDINEKQARNIYLSQLILNMNDRKLIYPFNVPPTSDPLSLDGVFKHITAKPSAEVEKEMEVGVVDSVRASVKTNTIMMCKISKSLKFQIGRLNDD